MAFASGTTGIASRQQLVASLTSAGFGVVEPNYVGSWSSDGEFSWFGGVKDVEAVVRYVRGAEASAVGLDESGSFWSGTATERGSH